MNQHTDTACGGIIISILCIPALSSKIILWCSSRLETVCVFHGSQPKQTVGRRRIARWLYQVREKAWKCKSSKASRHWWQWWMWKMLQLMPCMYHQYHISTPFLSFLMLHSTNKQTNPCDQNIILTFCNNQNDDTNRYKAIMNLFFCPFFHLSIFFALTFFFF